MPLMETVTIINKSGKVVSTGKHLVNIFKDAKDAYQDKKAELKADHHARIKHKNDQKLLQAREETRSTTSSRHSHRSRSHKHRDPAAGPSRPPLTERNLSHISEGSVTSSRRSRSHHGSRTGPHSPREYHPPQVATEMSQPVLQRRHTDFPDASPSVASGTLPPPYTSQLSRMPPRSQSNPDFHSDDVDMNLAYGKLPPDLQVAQVDDLEKEQELKATMNKLDELLLEAHCLQHSATTIIANLQANPEAMAAVALTLAELSNILTKMSPGILTALKSSSPAVFALLASPQFLIAGGVALGVTVVMFGGYKIIKKIQANNEAQKDANRMEEAMVYEGTEMGSIDTWRRGIADAEVESVATSVDGEFITPEAARQKKERIKERKREERREERHGKSVRAESVVSGSVRSERTVRKAGSEATLRQRDIPIRSSSTMPPSESGRSSRSRKESKGKELVVVSEKEKKKKSALSVIFKRSKDKGKDIRESTVSHRPRVV
ncbi:hypothetical protein ONS95_009764 [Cadophora gregata]|uniref:uncharacterized protein n=1 Tax=Cadophora gregata TaxID=51156 RepID=UPI0026DBE664|nr:uncharacterized protein ONS95_009764 [Cadophora gregata]KAK0121470.1 hypothetical protein ONS95_009764 [Cadophora gregata]KAK0126942.1 hypothetical protein ONS96_006505 [Cadophora gregata f. sp. sojae]